MITFTLDTLLVVQMIIGVILPIFVGLVTTRVTSSAVKAWLLAALTVITSVLTGLVAAINSAVVFDLGLALLAALPQFFISVAMHFGLWKPTGISAAVQSVGEKA